MRVSKGVPDFRMRFGRAGVAFAVLAMALLSALARWSAAQSPKGGFAPTGGGASTSGAAVDGAGDAEAELQRGIALCREGRFQEALPHLTLAQGRVSETYAAAFNLALAYLGVGRYRDSIRTLKELRQSGESTAAVNNLLAQAYAGSGDQEAGFAALEEASRQTPRDERLYVFVADACTDHYEYKLGLRVVDVGLRQLPESARLHYERGIFLARLDRLEEGRPEFERAAALAPDSDIGYLAKVQEALYGNQLQEAARTAREGIQAGHRDYEMLELLGDILLRNGAVEGQPEFAEAKKLLEASVAANPNFSTAQMALGKVYLTEGQFRQAAEHLEIAERLEPLNPAIYTSLAAAYRQMGEAAKARECTAKLAALLQQQAAQK